MNIVDRLRSLGEMASPRARARKRTADAHYEQYLRDHANRQLRRQVAKGFQQQTGYSIQWNPRSMAHLANSSFEEMLGFVQQKNKAKETPGEER